jgi:ribosomal protein S6--L-glutamate ligase
MEPHNPRIALGKRLRSCPSVRCLGVQTNWDAYPQDAQDAMRNAEKIYYPSRLYEDLCLSLGKQVFPRNYYRFMGDKIRQTSLFQFLGIPHPRTRLYYGRQRAERILADFPLPLVAKTPVGSSMGQGVWLIRERAALDGYLQGHHPAYVQEYLPIDRDLRVVLLAGRVVHAYWRIATSGEFRNNVSCGAAISFENIPQEALDFAIDVVRRCRFDEVGLDICRADGRYCVIEANMVYGLEGFRRAGLTLADIFCRMDQEGSL